ncbi:Holliday junction resolvase RuvX [Marinagarivorans cellulosilyticus]|uniref:Putative pre-16S rRNA nuclease n=1 Tax=Marinagarivorans cellulosilyticus TaxID=2721545 RepID=A0AAN1WI35_9GAMM|nr:Holliday junction resolvase RuvX [Marinagarivorans cellulosilyticus]BCD98008.1 putative Holliday junction resolvase [Marinagarivorans cellulosilyticus]
MGYIIGFDYGLKNIGVAIGQSITRTASEQPSLAARDGIPNWEQVEKLLKEWKIDTAIVGLPLNMDGTDSELSTRTKKFANRLHGRFGITVHMMDERLSTREAKAEAAERGHKGNYGQNPIDAIAARLILESWLNQ